jgi:hypothetical protein
LKSVDLLGIIKNEMTRERKPAARRLPTFYPSEASAETPSGETLGGCWRKTWYRTNYVPASNQSDFYIKMIHSFGNHVEDIVAEQMKRAGIFESNSVKFYDPLYNLSGEIDIAGRYRKDDGSIGYYGVEVKSVYGMGGTQTITGRSRAWRGQPAFRPKPKESNLMQTMIYIDQFSPEKNAEVSLEGFKLIYFPRDKPIDGRSYNISLITKADLKGTLIEFADELVDNERYALVETDGHPDYVETRFSIDQIYRRFKTLKETLAGGEVPDRTFDKYYSAETVEEMHSSGRMSDSAYATFKAGKKTPGHFLCQSYCDYRDHCYNKNGSPRVEADSLVSITSSSSKQEPLSITS